MSQAHTQNMAYGLAMATTLTTNGMSGDFPPVYINLHGNSFSMCVGTLWAIHCVGAGECVFMVIQCCESMNE